MAEGVLTQKEMFKELLLLSKESSERDARIETRLDGVADALGKIDETLETMTERIDALEKKTVEQPLECNKRLSALENKGAQTALKVFGKVGNIVLGIVVAGFCALIWSAIKN